MITYKNDGKNASINVSFLPAYPFLTGWILMLVMGGLHNEIGPQIPDISYWLAVGIMLVVQIIVWLISKVVR